MLKRRTGRVKTHAVLNGLTGLVGAAAGLVSATMWQGYVFLAPCIVSAIYYNYVWRHWLGYDRPSVQQVQSETKGADKSTIVAALQFVSSAQDLLTRESSSPLFLHDLVADDSIASIASLHFEIRHVRGLLYASTQQRHNIIDQISSPMAG
jgi:hypothetical protein